MRKLIILCIGVVVIWLVLAWSMSQPGLTKISLGDFVVEMRTVTFGLFLLLAMLCISLIWRAVVWLLGIPRRQQKKQEWEATEGAQLNLENGITQLAAGNWRSAAQLLKSAAKVPSHQFLANMALARVAQMHNAWDRRDDFLEAALETPDDDKELAVLVTQAELQLQSGQLESALTAIERVRSQQPKSEYAMALHAKILARLNHWQDLRKLVEQLPDQDMEKVTSAPWFKDFLGGVLQADNVDSLLVDWLALPGPIRKRLDAQKLMARRLCDLDHKRCAEFIKERLPDPNLGELAKRFGHLYHNDLPEAIEAARSWLASCPEHPDYLQCLGKLLARCRYWDKAQTNLKASLKAAPNPESHYELAQLFESMGKDAKANAHFQEGLALAVSEK